MAVKEKKASGVGALVFTVLALLFTGITAWLLATMLSGSQYTKEPVRPVVVVKSTIEPLQPLTEALLKVVKMPESTVPPGAFGQISDLLTTPAPVPAVRLFAGEAVIKDRLADPKSGRGLSTLVPNGMRAMTVRLDDAAVQARLFYPEATVDVLATVRLIKQSTVVTRIIVQNVKVLAVGTTVDPSHMAEPAGAGAMAGKEDQKDSVVTLLVTPVQAEQLVLASREGRLDLVLRSQQDVEVPETIGSQPEDLFPGLVVEDETGNKDQERRESVQRILATPRFRREGGAGSVQVQ